MRALGIERRAQTRRGLTGIPYTRSGSYTFALIQKHPNLGEQEAKFNAYNDNIIECIVLCVVQTEHWLNTLDDSGLLASVSKKV